MQVGESVVAPPGRRQPPVLEPRKDGAKCPIGCMAVRTWCENPAPLHSGLEWWI